ncbi:oxidoreductase [Stachybotrys elegans]|uniref:Oxidoreductase n=1 Tax=Stachybotrys elegans TaxID=80388 RepID=A0A8K0WJN1_9HYPO|nr:oxidoreductase [Stachybotrys elegans]
MTSLSGTTPAVSANNFEIPLIDFGAFRQGDEKAKTETAKAILSGFQRAGFIYLYNHGISKASVSQAFDESVRFFKRPLAQKEELAWTTPEANRGYVRQGREKLASDNVNDGDVDKQRESEGQDLKETMNIGREGDGFDNHWPDSFDNEGKMFKSSMLAFFDECQHVNLEIMRAIAVGLGIQEHWFDSFCDAGDNTLRLLHYPKVSTEVFRKNKFQVRAGAHTDYGSITLLFQDMAGGLQVQSPDGTFVDATPIADTIVVNAGDMLARWSNDTIKSTKHRVIEPQKGSLENGTHPARYSIAYFCIPNVDSLIEAIPGTYDDAQDRKYPSIKSKQYLVQRLAATF